MNKEIKLRLKWIELYEETNNAGLVCRRCGISRPTLRKWYKQYKEKGLDGLQDVSRRPHSSPNSKINNRIEEWILKLRKIENLVPEEFKMSFFASIISAIACFNSQRADQT